MDPLCPLKFLAFHQIITKNYKILPRDYYDVREELINSFIEKINLIRQNHEESLIAIYRETKRLSDRTLVYTIRHNYVQLWIEILKNPNAEIIEEIKAYAGLAMLSDREELFNSLYSEANARPWIKETYFSSLVIHTYSLLCSIKSKLICHRIVTVNNQMKMREKYMPDSPKRFIQLIAWDSI